MENIINYRILVIDDNALIHEDFRKILIVNVDEYKSMDKLKSVLFNETTTRKASINYEIDSAYQGEEGFLLVKKSLEEKRPYAVAFVDILMPPGWDGVETIKQIWKIDPDIQVAICTAHAEYSWDDIIAELGFSDRLLILKKPFDTIEIRQMACCLVKKWSLNNQVGHQYDRLHELLMAQQKQTNEMLLSDKDDL